MRFKLVVVLVSTFLLSCTSSEDYSSNPEAAHLVGSCFKLIEPAFVFEGRCADLSGLNNNSELCNAIQAQGFGDFPKDWETYIENRATLDTSLFERLALEIQRSMLFPLEKGAEFTVTRLVHHGWGTIGRFWVVRGNVRHKGSLIEVELPSSDLIHHAPYWLKGKSTQIPKINEVFLESCGV